MNRREALSATALLLGGTIVGAGTFLSGCRTAPKKDGLFGIDELSLLDEVGETILPATDSSPGAKEAKIAGFMKTIVTDCYDEQQQKIFMEGITKLNDESRKKYSVDFIDLSATDKHDLLIAIGAEAKEFQKNKREGAPDHYFTMMKQLTIWGYFSSEPGATKALRYVAVPGRFEGCIPYKKGDRAWAL